MSFDCKHVFFEDMNIWKLNFKWASVFDTMVFGKFTTSELEQFCENKLTIYYLDVKFLEEEGGGDFVGYVFSIVLYKGKEWNKY